MVRGNKFKPKPAPAPEPEPAPPVTAEPEAAPAGAGAAELVQTQRKKKRSKSKQQQGSLQPAGSSPASNGTAAAASAGTVGGPSGSKPPKKKRKVMNGSAAAAGDAAAAAAPGKAAAAAAAARSAKAAPAAAAAPLIPTLVAPLPPKPGAAGAVGSNWAALKSVLAAQQAQQQGRGKPRGMPGGKRKGMGRAGGSGDDDEVQDAKPQAGQLQQSMGLEQGLTKVLAIDCEMVGVGPNGSRSVLARVCIVNSAGNVLLDTHVKPKETVTDYRTKVSGVRPLHLQDAPDFSSVQNRVVDALRGRVVVGHALTNDLKVLLLSHPRKDIRDTSRYPPLMQSQGSKRRPKSLRQLAQEELGLVIQAGEHNPVDDARAALYLYLKHRKEWERWLAKGGKPPRTEPHQPPKKKLKAAGAALQGQQQQQLSCVPRMKQMLEQLAANDYMADL